MSRVVINHFVPAPNEVTTTLSAELDALEKLKAAIERAMHGEGVAQVEMENVQGAYNLWIIRCSNPKPVS